MPHSHLTHPSVRMERPAIQGRDPKHALPLPPATVPGVLRDAATEVAQELRRRFPAGSDAWVAAALAAGMLALHPGTWVAEPAP